MKKDAGFIERILPVLLSIGLVFGLVLLSGQFMKVLQIREEVNQIARTGILRMETKGFLTDEDASELEKALEKVSGISDVTFLGSTMQPVSYGEEIELSIQGKISTKLQIAIPYLYEESKEWDIPVNIRMFSTAKH